MANDAQIGIKVTADVTQANAALKTIAASTKQVGDAAKITSTSINDASGAFAKQTFRLNDNERILQRVAVAETEVAVAAKEAGTAIDEAGQKSGKAAGGFTKAYSGLRTLANILPGIGIGGLVGVAFEAISSAVGELATSLGSASEAQSLLNKTMSEATGKVAGEKAELSSLVAIIKDETNSREVRTRAFKELQAEYPNAFKNMSLETTNLGDLEKALDKVTNALVRQAQIKGLESAIGKIAAEQAELLAGGATDLLKAASAWDILKVAVSGVTGVGSLVTNTLDKQQDKLTALNKALQDLIKTDLAADGKTTRGKSEATTKAPKEKLQKEFDAKPISIKYGLDLDTSNYDPVKIVQKKFDGTPLDLKFNFDQDSADLLKKTENLGTDISDILTGAVNQGIVDVSESIGEALATGDFSKIGSKIIGEIGGVVEELGKALIAFAGVKIAIDIAGKSLNPYIALAAGVAAVIAGSALKASGNKQHAFADGGIVTGPTNALIGEAGPEVVFPLDKLNRFIGRNTNSGNMNVTGSVRVNGQDLLIAFSRASKNQSLVG